MSDPNTKRVSLEELETLNEQGKLYHDPSAPEGGEDLGPDFWKNARVEGPKRPRSVHLKLDPEVFEFFYATAKGKGHLTQMQNVLRAYANAHKHD